MYSLFNNKIDEKSFLLNYLRCFKCDKYLIGENKAFLLKCGHNICALCLKGKETLKCLICLESLNKNELEKTFPNFVVEEIINKLNKKGVVDLTLNLNSGINEFFCVFCDQKVGNKEFHLKLHPTHKIEKLELILENKENFAFNEKREQKNLFNSDFVENYSNNLVNQIFEKLSKETQNLKNEKNNLKTIYDFNLLSDEEFELLKEFKNEKVLHKKNLTSHDFDAKNLSIQKILQIQRIVKTKLNTLPDKVDQIKKDLQDMNPENFSEEISTEITNYFKNFSNFPQNFKKYNQLYFFDQKTNSILYSNSITLPEIKRINTGWLTESLADFSIAGDGLNALYLTGGNENGSKNYFNIIKMDDNDSITSVTKGPNMIYCRSNHFSVYNELKLYVIGGDFLITNETSCEYFDFIYNIWVELPKIPKILKSIKCFIRNNKLYVFDKLTYCFYIDLELKKEWKSLDFLYFDNEIKSLIQFSFIMTEKDEIFIIGGKYQKIKKNFYFNENILNLIINNDFIKITDKKSFGIKGTFDQSTSTFWLKNIDNDDPNYYNFVHNPENQTNLSTVRLN